MEHALHTFYILHFTFYIIHYTYSLSLQHEAKQSNKENSKMA